MVGIRKVGGAAPWRDQMGLRGIKRGRLVGIRKWGDGKKCSRGRLENQGEGGD